MISQLRQHRSKDFEAQIFFVSKTVRASLDDANLVVESLDKSQRHFVLGSTVSSNAIPMTLDHLSKLLVGPKPAPFERRLPVFKESSGPTLALVAPQLTERLFEQIGAVQAFVSTEQGVQRLAAFESQVLPTRQQRVLLPLDKAAVSN